MHFVHYLHTIIGRQSQFALDLEDDYFVILLVSAFLPSCHFKLPCCPPSRFRMSTGVGLTKVPSEGRAEESFEVAMAGFQSRLIGGYYL
jgi:hypothetical protein